MKIFITGATGFIGKNLVRYLLEHDHQIYALYRNFDKIKELESPGIKWFKGDILNPESLENAMKGCEVVLHLAAYAKVWSKDKLIYRKLNYIGTKNVLETALKSNVQKVVVVSTAGVFGPSDNLNPVNEESTRVVDYFSDYERTKDEADKMIIRDYAKKLDVSIVCPTRVYGPGELSQSNSFTKIIKQYKRSKFRFMPGNGDSIGNYVFVEDVVKGILLAMEKGRSGERYLLGGENLSFSQIFVHLAAITGEKHKMVKLPVFLMLFLAHIFQLLATVFSIKPLITPGWARKYLHNWVVSSDKAKTELGYNPISFKEGCRKTIEWLKGKS